MANGLWNCFETLPPLLAESNGIIPSLTDISWSSSEENAFLFGMYVFEKQIPQVRKFVKTKSMGQMLCYYYGQFRRSDMYLHWKECHKKGNKKCLYGKKILTICKRKKFVNDLLSRVPEESKANLIQIFKFFKDKIITFDEYVIALMTAVGVNVFIENAEIGKVYPNNKDETKNLEMYHEIVRRHPRIGDQYQAEIPTLSYEVLVV